VRCRLIDVPVSAPLTVIAAPCAARAGVQDVPRRVPRVAIGPTEAILKPRQMATTDSTPRTKFQMASVFLLDSQFVRSALAHAYLGCDTSAHYAATFLRASGIPVVQPSSRHLASDRYWLSSGKGKLGYKRLSLDFPSVTYAIESGMTLRRPSLGLARIWRFHAHLLHRFPNVTSRAQARHDCARRRLPNPAGIITSPRSKRPVSLKCFGGLSGLCPATFAVVLNKCFACVPIPYTNARARAAAARNSITSQLDLPFPAQAAQFHIESSFPELQRMAIKPSVMGGIGDLLMRAGFFDSVAYTSPQPTGSMSPPGFWRAAGAEG